MPFALRTSNIQSSQTLAITSLVDSMRREGKTVIDLGAGEPDFDTPAVIRQAAIQAINDGFTKYTPVSGMFELKEAICRKYKNENGIDFEPANIVVTCGAKHAIINALLALCEEGDDVVIPAPYWASYVEQVRFVGATPIILHTSEETAFKITPEQLEASITPQTKVLLLNTPANPTGAVYSKSEIDALVKIIDAHDFFVIFDEIYEKIIYDGMQHVSLASYSEIKDRVLTVNGVSKSFAMTGWRIGYLAANEAVCKAVAKIQSHTTSNPCSISQKASVAALQADSGILRPMHTAFNERRKFLFAQLSGIPGFSCALPKGAFYMFPNVSSFFGKKAGDSTLTNALDFCSFLLKDAGVAAVPGEAFGSSNHIRISYAASLDLLQEAVKNIKDAVRKLGD